MFKWLEELYEIRLRYWERQDEQTRSNKVCSSCEVLKEQLDLVNREKAQLLSKLLTPETKTEPTVAQPMQSLPKRNHLPFRVKQQMLEAEDRERAKALRNASQPDTESIEDLEKELNIVQNERENPVLDSNH